MLVARANEWVKRHNLKQEEQGKNVNLRKFAKKKNRKKLFQLISSCLSGYLLCQPITFQKTVLFPHTG